jgi:predicted nucleotidyltransferase
MYLDNYQNHLSVLCRQYNVKALYAFGSVLTERFSNNSDVDLIVDFDKKAIDDCFLNYFDFKYSLEDLFKRKVDLLEEQPIRNPVLRRTIERNKQLIYGRAN